ncbi:MAG: PAS domain S-box protein [archaeon]
MKIYTQIITVFFIVAVTLYLLGSGYLYSQQSVILMDSADQYIKLISDSKASQIVAWIDSLEENFRVNADSIVFQDYLEMTPGDLMEGEKFSRMEQRINSLMTLPSMDHIIIINTSGKIVGSSDKELIGQDYSQNELFLRSKSSIKKTGPVVGRKGLPVLRITGPIVSSNTHKFIGVFLMEISMQTANDILADKVGLGKTGEVFMTDGQGTLISPLTGYSTNDILAKKIEIESVEDCINDYAIKAVPGNPISPHEEPIVAETDFLDTPVFTTHSYAPEMGWCVIAQISRQEIFGKYTEGLLVSNLVTGALLIIIAVIVSIFLARRIGDPIIGLSKNVSDILEGKLDTKLEKSSINEINDLSNNLNKVLASLKIAVQKVGVSPEDIGLGEALAAKRMAEAKAQQYFDLAANILVVLDNEGNIVSLNKSGYDILGYDNGSLIGKNWFDTAIRKEDRKKLRSLFAGAIKGEIELPHYKTYVITKNGLIRNIDWSNSLVKDDFGNTWKMVSSGVDITDTEKAHEELVASEERYRLISEGTSDLISVFTFELSPKYIYASPSHMQILGYTPKELLGKSSLSFVHPTDRTKLIFILQGYLKSILSGKISMAHENLILRFRHKNGSWRTLDSTANILENHIIFISRDITERKNIEEALKSSEAQFKSLFEASPFGMHMYKIMPNGDLIFVGANPSADRILGVDNKQFVGKTIEQAFPALKSTPVPEAYKKVVRTGKGWHDEQIIYNENKISGAFDVYAFRTSPDRMVALFTDETEKIKLSEAVAEAENIYKTLLDTCLEAVTMFDKEGKILFINEISAARFGKKPKECIGKSLYEFIPKSKSSLSPDKIIEAAKTLKPSVIDSPVIINGEKKLFHISINPFTKQGKLEAVLVVSHEIHSPKTNEMERK